MTHSVKSKTGGITTCSCGRTFTSDRAWFGHTGLYNSPVRAVPPVPAEPAALVPETCLTCDGNGTHYDDKAMEYWDCSDCLGLGVRVGVQP